MDKGKRQYSILVVDDDPPVRSLIADFLRDTEGYTVFTAAGGQEALDAVLPRHRIDLVLSDINMPGMKGFELLRTVRKGYPEAKRVLITAYNVEDYLELALKYDIGNVFVKTTPFNFDELSSVLSNLLTEDIFGLDRYFRDSGAPMHSHIIDRADNLHDRAKWLVESMPATGNGTKLTLVLVELLTNAIFYGVRDESPERKEQWDRDFTIAPEESVRFTWASDGEKLGISIVDRGGRLKKSDVIFWLNRQTARDSKGLPMGVYDSHGRGFFITRSYIDRLIINIKRGVMSEVVIINYFNRKYRGYKPLYINEL